MATSKEKLQIIVDAQGIAKTKAQLKGMEKATGGTTKSFGLMAVGIAGATAALYALGKATSFAIRVGKEFEQSMANVKAISGATAIQFRALEKNAMQLGATTKFTASEVAGLQTEFSKLGFTATEINKVTKGTLALASAVDADLATSAAVAGATLRGFGLDASETGRVTDIMAKSFASSALDMDKFSNSMTYVAPVAKIAGFGIEGTTAMLGKLANAGIDGSMAGTALRKIFLELSNESSKLSKRLGGSVSSVDELVPALQKLNAEGVSTAEMKDLVGQRAISAFSILLDGADDLDTLSESFRNAGGSAQEMADIQLDTLEGKLTIMMSALSALGISFFKIIDGPLKGLVDGFTSVVSGVDKVVKVFSFQSDETKVLIKTMKDHEDAIRGIISANADLSFQQEESRNVKLQNELNELTAQYAASRDAVKAMVFEIENTNIMNDEYYKQLVKNIELEGANRDAILETINAKGEDVEASNRRMAALKKDGDPPDPAKTLGIPTEDEAIQAMEMLQQYQFATLSIKEQAAIQELESLKATKEQILSVEKFYDQQRWKSALNTTGKLLGAMSQLNSASKGSALVTARLQQGAIIANTASAAMAAITPPTGAPTPLGYANMAAVIVTGIAQGVQIEQGLSQIKGAATGMDEVVNKPTMILAGEAGAEQVSITPLEGPNIDGPQGGGSITVNVSGNVLSQDFVEGELAENIKEAIRRGTDFGIS